MRRSLPLIAAALLAASCIHIDSKPVAPAETAAALENRSLDDAKMQEWVAAHSTARVPITRWNVDTLTLAAFYFHPDLDVARAQAAVARAAVITAGARPDPTLNLPIEHRAEAHPWVIVPNIDLTIETANKRGLRVRQASEAARAADIAIAQQAWQIRSTLRAQLAALHAAQIGVDALDRQRSVQADLVQALEKRFELGESSRVELTQARISARQTDLLRLDRLAQIAQAHARLAAAIGIPERGIAGAQFDFEPALPEAPANLRERALLARPDVLASLADYAAAEAALRLELARQYPDIHLTAGLGWDAGVRRWDLGLSSVLPVLSRNRGPIGEALARRSLSEANLMALQSRIIGALDEATAVYTEAKRRVDATSAVIAAQRQQVEAARKSFNAGETDRVVLRTAELELEAAEVAHADAMAQAQAAFGALEDAVEQPLTGAPLPATFERDVQ